MRNDAKLRTCPKEFISFAHHLADLGSQVHRRYFRAPLEMTVKNDLSPVTLVDRETELVLRDALERAYPNHGIQGEEYGSVRENSELVWLLDPIDGTESFISGLPLFCLLIGLVWEGSFTLGLIDQPILQDRWVGADGNGTSMNGRLVRTRTCQYLRDAILHSGGPALDGAAEDASIARVRAACHGFRCGVESYTFGLLASGFIDIVLDYDYDVHDFGPLEPVIRNAGGILTDFAGRRLQSNSDGRVLAVGDVCLLPQVIARLATGG